MLKSFLIQLFLDDIMDKEKMVRRKINGAKRKLKEYAEELDLSKDIVNKGNFVLESYVGEVNPSTRPNYLAAGAIYLTSILTGERMTQERISNALNISSCAIGQNYRKLRECLDMDIIL